MKTYKPVSGKQIEVGKVYTWGIRSTDYECIKKYLNGSILFCTKNGNHALTLPDDVRDYHEVTEPRSVKMNLYLYEYNGKLWWMETNRSKAEIEDKGCKLLAWKEVTLVEGEGIG